MERMSQVVCGFGKIVKTLKKWPKNPHTGWTESTQPSSWHREDHSEDHSLLSESTSRVLACLSLPTWSFHSSQLHPWTPSFPSIYFPLTLSGKTSSWNVPEPVPLATWESLYSNKLKWNAIENWVPWLLWPHFKWSEATFQVVRGHMWPLAALLDVDMEHFHHPRKFWWTVLKDSSSAFITSYTPSSQCGHQNWNCSQ